MYKYRNRRLNENHLEKEQKGITQQNQEEMKTRRNQLNNYESLPNQRIGFKRNFENDCIMR